MSTCNCHRPDRNCKKCREECGNYSFNPVFKFGKSVSPLGEPGIFIPTKAKEILDSEHVYVPYIPISYTPTIKLDEIKNRKFNISGSKTTPASASTTYTSVTKKLEKEINSFEPVFEPKKVEKPKYIDTEPDKVREYIGSLFNEPYIAVETDNINDWLDSMKKIIEQSMDCSSVIKKDGMLFIDTEANMSTAMDNIKNWIK